MQPSDPGAQPPMRIIQGLTTSFREAQDRLYIATKDDAGRAAGLWLTRRLADRLVRQLAVELDRAAPAGEAQTPSRTAAHVWHQSIAQARQVSGKPVPAAAASDEALIDSVTLAQLNGRLRLVFNCPDTTPAALFLDNTQLRQWLGILFRNYRLAEWATEGVWPSWFDEAAAQSFAPTQSGMAVH